MNILIELQENGKIRMTIIGNEFWITTVPVKINEIKNQSNENIIIKEKKISKKRKFSSKINNNTKRTR